MEIQHEATNWHDSHFPIPDMMDAGLNSSQHRCLSDKWDSRIKIAGSQTLSKRFIDPIRK